MDLETAISVALAVFGAGGVPLSRDQLAGVMGTNAGSGTFITKVATARTFGLITFAQGKYELTNLGFSIVDSDENRQRAARAEAFLTVPLYRRTYEEFKGRQLPPRPHGLEQAFAKFGVSSKQTYNARLAFEKSGKQAGFFAASPERLVEPILIGSPGATGATGATGPTGPTGPSGATGLPATRFYGGGDGLIIEDRLDLDPLIRGLLSRLPKKGDKWEMDKRTRWLQTLAANFDMVYTTDDDDKIIIIECKSPKSP
jgi:hypothetical protein